MRQIINSVGRFFLIQLLFAGISQGNPAQPGLRPAFAEDVYIINNNVAARSAPDQKARSVVKLNFGDVLQRLEENGDWIKVNVSLWEDGGPGELWIRKKDIEYPVITSLGTNIAEKYREEAKSVSGIPKEMEVPGFVIPGYIRNDRLRFEKFVAVIQKRIDLKRYFTAFRLCYPKRFSLELAGALENGAYHRLAYRELFGYLDSAKNERNDPAGRLLNAFEQHKRFLLITANLDLLLKKYPQSESAYFHKKLSEYYFYAGDHRKVVEHNSTIVEKFSQDKRLAKAAVHGVADALYRTGDLKRARAQWEYIRDKHIVGPNMKEDEWAAEIKKRLADIELELGNREKAKQLYREIGIKRHELEREAWLEQVLEAFKKQDWQKETILQ